MFLNLTFVGLHLVQCIYAYYNVNVNLAYSYDNILSIIIFNHDFKNQMSREFLRSLNMIQVFPFKNLNLRNAVKYLTLQR